MFKAMRIFILKLLKFRKPKLGIGIRIFKGVSDISLVFKKVLKTVEIRIGRVRLSKNHIRTYFPNSVGRQALNNLA